MQINKRLSSSITLGLVLLTASVLTACEPTDEVAAPEITIPEGESGPSDCREFFVREIVPVSINGGHHLYFEPFSIAFLADPLLRIQSVDLVATLRGKMKGSAFEVPLAVNGLQTSGRDGGSVYELIRYAAQSDSSDVRHRLHKLIVNGGEPIHKFMLHVLKNKGVIKLSLQGKDLHVLNAGIRVSGYSVAGCSNPDPDPTPTPTPTLPAQAPKTVLDSVVPAALVTSSSVISFTFSSDQLGVGFECSLDGSARAACSSPQAYSDLSDGAHVFQVFAKNAAGIADPAGAQHSWTVNSLLPGATLDNMSALPGVTSSSSIQFSFSQDGAASYQCSIDGGEFLPCVSPVVYSDLAEGLHQFSVTSVDANGNVANNPAQFQWVIDATAPVTSILQVTPSVSPNSSSSIEIAFMASESAVFECELDGGGFSACESPFQISELAEGEHVFSARARDAAGNIGNAVGYAWVSDFTEPVIALGQVLPAAGATSSKMISVEFQANELAGFECSFDGAAFEACASPFVAPVFAEGNHALVVVATDPSGNRSAPISLEWLMDFASPEIAFSEILPSAASHINSSWLSASVDMSESAVLVSTLNGDVLSGSGSPVELTGLAEGAYELLVSGTDAVGNASNSILHSFTVDFTAPVVDIVADFADVSTNSSANAIVFTANEPASFECQLNGAGFASCSSPLSIGGLAEGNHLVEIRATDLAGNSGPVASVAWVVDLTAPVVTLSVGRDQNASIQFDFVSNEAGALFLCSMDGAIFESCISPVIYSGVPVGTHSFAVKAQDVAGNISAPASHAWSVDPPVTTFIAGVSPATNPTNQNSVSIGFGSNAGLSFRCGLDGGALVTCASPMVYSPVADGTHQFKVHAVDRWGSMDPVGAAYSWTVDTQAPIVGTIGTATTSTSITVTWTTNELASSGLNWGVGYDTSRVVGPDGNFVVTRSVKLVGLMPNTLYSFIVMGKDKAGNAYSSTRRSIRTNY
ncbi:MAG: hypothetical protein A2X94_11575 [Bdellovibrionales bacterium GWB1_55_8]|nr:MAG: hypothetical protein A2X94_11575 [Bdellovibrionales bacterium GWB1_55_8]